MFLLSLRQDHFSNKTIKLLGPTPPVLCLKNRDIFIQIQQKRPQRHLWWLVSEKRTHQLPENIFPLSLMQDHFSNKTIKFLGPTPHFYISKTVIFSLKFSKNDRIRHIWWLVSKTRMHQLPENMFLLRLRRNHFSN